MLKIFYLALLFIGAASMGLGSEESPCAISHAEREELMKLNFDAFDQTMGEGWRKYSDQGCKKEATSLLEDYFEIHQAELESAPSLLLPTLQEDHRR